MNPQDALLTGSREGELVRMNRMLRMISECNQALVIADLPVPKPKPNEALVQIKAAGVNFIDVYFREGRYPAQLPFINGQEAGGIVTEVGSEVTAFEPGDRVAYTGAVGSYAEYAAVPASRLIKIPDDLTFEQAAAVPGVASAEPAPPPEGGLLIRAALRYDPRQAKGLAEALRTLTSRSEPQWLLAAVAVGLASYGLYELFEARYRRIRAA